MSPMQVATLPLAPTTTVSQSSPRARNWRRRLVITGVVALVVFHLYQVIRENWHVALPGKVYRSGQLTPSGLKNRVERHGVRTVFNLRGFNPDKDWYIAERQAASECGVKHVDLQVGSKFSPTAEQLRELILALEACETPLLVHCESGIDRSGPVAGISVLLLDTQCTVEQAKGQITVWRGHWPTLKATKRQRGFFELYESWLETTGRNHDPTHFRVWAMTVYAKPPEWD